MVGLGLLLINILIGYPSCSPPSETEAPTSLPTDPPGVRIFWKGPFSDVMC